MSRFYSVGIHRNNYHSQSLLPYKLSRTKIDLFLNCPRCFYLDRKLGISQPPGFPFSLNSAVDKLLKKEFDIHRANSASHPLMKTYGIDAVPFQHEDINNWRDPFKGIRYYHSDLNFDIYGAIDDVWINPSKELHIVDYKATAKDSEVTLDADWQIGYKRQMEIYQWLFHKNNFKVSHLGYFVYANGITDRKAFDGKLEFRVSILLYEGNFDWIETALRQLKDCLESDKIPQANPDCDFCLYRHSAHQAEDGASL
ncbi:hypothetical protein A3D78_00740 [Candidatus Gottesmanbacteria bacterium RIFCSPHIGHO2_02_FULL_39_14]|uniref:PD-(D/E)XK endonuclease-like domain-containing protein n=2 Tax=Candidatus Gottesmaniibacteriota TaxID=1752720 RepID=A0A1F6A088_9BACT|nr:MAG: hypothetical protein A3D78_00740 [Candidatus Gottesmanbacteria bacterium RIFCSPHIGHO2_02_FULL_39_14]OGG32289.1 MAG: hypothetical protein A3I51_01350 [Candidatus Gottesmanbacteria bacterium RIFCSPLOWO2_02_FULL_38_8]